MKVLLVSANTETVPYPVYPIGLDYVAAAVSRTHAVRICDMNLLGDAGELKKAISTFGPDVVGIAIRNIDNTDAADPIAYIGAYRELIAAVRDASRAVIVLGGAGFTMFPKALLTALEADYGIIGEGERLALFLDTLADNRPLRDIPGLIHPGGPESFPPPWDAAVSRRSCAKDGHLGFYLRNGGMLNLQTKRGCLHRCIYCTYPHIEGRRLRLESPATVAETALALERAGARYLFITDSVFNMNTEHNREVANAFRRVGLTIPWGAFFAPGKIPHGYFDDLVKAGMTHVEFGTESLTNRVLNAYRKPFQVDDVMAAHEAALAAGLHIAHYFLLGGPGECASTIDKTLSRIDNLKNSALFLFTGMRVYPHTELYELALEEGQIGAGQDLLEPVYYQSPKIDFSALVSKVKQAAARQTNWVFGAGGQATGAILSKMYEKGYSGPLWEYLIR